MKEFDGNFYDKDYYERGRETGKSWLQNYHWMPRRSFKEAFAFIDYLGLSERDFVLDFGCAKGFLVRALRELEIMADGCDISEYALSFAPKGCWNCGDLSQWENKKYSHVLVKDVFEHMTKKQLYQTLQKISKLSPLIMCVIPMGDKGIYRIPEYHKDMSHIIAEDEEWWEKSFLDNNWNIVKECYHVLGLKDNWSHIEKGNCVFVIERATNE